MDKLVLHLFLTEDDMPVKDPCKATSTHEYKLAMNAISHCINHPGSNNSTKCHLAWSLLTLHCHMELQCKCKTGAPFSCSFESYIPNGRSLTCTGQNCTTSKLQNKESGNGIDGMISWAFTYCCEQSCAGIWWSKESCMRGNTMAMSDITCRICVKLVPWKTLECPLNVCGEWWMVCVLQHACTFTYMMSQ